MTAATTPEQRWRPAYRSTLDRPHSMVIALILIVASVAGATIPFMMNVVSGGTPFALLSVAAASVVVFGRGRIAAMAGSAIFITLLHVAYVTLVSPAYAYAGLGYNDPSFPSLAVAVGLAWLPAWWLPVALGRPSDVFVWAIYLVAYVPAFLVPTYILPGEYASLPLQLTMMAGFSLIMLANRLPLPRSSPMKGLSPMAFTQLVWLMIVVTVPALIFTFGVSFDLPALDAVYEQRDEYKEALAEAGRLAGYLGQWGGTVVFPTLLALGLGSSRLTWIAVAILGQLYMYSITGFKSFALAILLIIGVHILVRWRGRRLASTASGGAALVVGLASLLSLGGENIAFVFSVLVRRLLVIPGALAGHYYDYFSSNESYALSHSILSFLNPGSVDILTPARMIGWVYFGDPAVNANASFWADGMANFGLWGVLLASVVLALLLRLLDRATVGRSLTFMAPLVALTAYEFSQGALLTSLLTGGAMFIALLLILSPTDVEEPPTGLAVSPLDGATTAERPSLSRAD